VKTEEQTISIAQYADGTLPAVERSRVEALLETDAELQAFLSEERALTTLLRSDPLPKMDWDALAVRFSSAIDEEIEQRIERASLALRLRRTASYFGARGFIAAVASFIVGIGLATVVMRTSSKPNPIVAETNGTTVEQQPLQSVAVVDGPREDQPIGRAVEEISIGPGGTYAGASAPSPYSEEISNRPARVMIAAEAPQLLQNAPPASPF